MNDKPEIFTSAEAAAYCGMDPDGFRWYLRSGQIKPDLVKPRDHLYTRATLDAFLARPKRKRGPHPKRVACPSCGHAFALREAAPGS